MMSVEILYKTTDITKSKNVGLFKRKYNKLLGELSNFSAVRHTKRKTNEIKTLLLIYNSTTC